MRKCSERYALFRAWSRRPSPTMNRFVQVPDGPCRLLLVVRRNRSTGNGTDGIYVCWRVKHGRFETNEVRANQRAGISIGHKDTDNLLRANQIRGNHQAGVFFRNETEGMAAHRNRLEANVIENNGVTNDAPGIAIRGATSDLVFRENIIRDTRAGENQRQRVGIEIGAQAGRVTLDDNQVEAARPVEDRRRPGDQGP